MCVRCIHFVFVSNIFRLELFPQCNIFCFHFMIISNIMWIRVITKLPNTEHSSKGKGKTHKSTNRQNQLTTGKLGKPQWPWLGTGISIEMVGWIRFYSAKPPASIAVKIWIKAEILLKVALNTITVTQVGHDIILFMNSSSKSYTPSMISSPRLYTSCLVTHAQDCSFHNNNGSATSPETKWSFSHVGYKGYLVNHIGASLSLQLWMLSLGCFRVSLWNRGPTVVDNNKWILVW
jgi:hypothetical protein